MTAVLSSDMRLETLFNRKLDFLTTQLLAATDVERMLQPWCDALVPLFNAERISLYLASPDGASIVSKVTTGRNLSQKLRFPVSPQSLAGYVAMTKRQLHILDAYDAVALRTIHPDLKFVGSIDNDTGYRSTQMMITPIVMNTPSQKLRGVLFVINNKAELRFTEFELDGCTRICKSLSTVL
ncbi:MAG: GAF domain-containing protein [Burkholderiaceae bacterium]|nr:GAF domain-containing protein [Burkholderiaceae bacterium]